MLRSRKYKKTNTTIPKQSPYKLNNQDTPKSQNKFNNYNDTNNNSTYENTYTQRTNKTIHIPDYFNDDNNTPMTWFNTAVNLAHLENVHEEHEISGAIVMKLRAKIIKQINNEIEKLKKSKNPLDLLRKTLNEKFTNTNRNILNSCIEDRYLGNRKPSEIYRSLKQKLNQIEENSEFVKTFFLRSLPDSIRIQLATATADSGEELAELADRIYAETNLEVNHIHNKNKNEINENQNILTEINKQFEKFNTQLKNLENRINDFEINANRGNHKEKTFNKKWNSNRRANDNKNNLCWYHETFGVQAFRCQSPCNFNNLNQASHHPQHPG